jgi:1-acyl-sn-glycerol-3-phosphate acyltransferase
MLIHTVYRLRKTGLDNIPETGPAILTCNHVSFVDALVIAAACPRPIRFVMDHNIFKIPLLSFVFKTGKAIPIASAKENIAMRDSAFEAAAQALKDGDLVGIFPEGRITDTGEMYPFRPGVMEILKRQPAPVVPLALCGLWGSFFSRKGGAAMTKPFRRGAFARVELKAAAEWAPQTVTPEGLQAATLDMRGEWR